MPGLDVLPAQDHLRRADAVLEGLDRPRGRLRRLLSPFADSYDVVVLDCPPGLDLLAEAVLRAADLVAVPLVPSPLSARMLSSLDAFIAGWERAPVPVAPFLTMVQARSRDHQSAIAGLRLADARLLDGVVPVCAELERLGSERAPVQSYAPTSRGARAYAAMWAQLDQRLGN